MIIDCHVHMAALDPGYAGNHVSPSLRQRWRFRLMLSQLGLVHDRPDPELSRAYSELLRRWLAGSRIDRAVVLALDAAHRHDGERDLDRTVMAVDNDCVADLAESDAKVLFGASVHPFRRDALDELDRVAARGACLVKWLPSSQGIAPDDPKCFPFYERLASLGLPLLTHVGAEHTLRARPDALNDPERLLPALERGVTVIAAHCGTRLFLYERSRFGAWSEMALRYPRLYGDLSAFLAVTRVPALRAIRSTPALAAKVVYGSDFPAPIWPLNLLGAIGLRDYLRLRRIENPIERSIASLFATGLPPSTFSRAAGLLRRT